MKIAYLDCFSGISGNMLLGALAELGVGEEALHADLAGLSLKGWNLRLRRVKRGALSATLAEVEITEPQPRRSLSDILSLLRKARLAGFVKEKAEEVFCRLAQAESEVHGQPPEEVHFHEVGAADALIDVVGALTGLLRLGVEKVYCSPLPVARGWLALSDLSRAFIPSEAEEKPREAEGVETGHGPLPLPAPATALLLRNVPTYGVEGEMELVTPTGAALAVTLAEGFGPQPAMTVRGIGCGAGSAQLPWPNVLRVFLGEAAEDGIPASTGMERVALLETNLDDMNPELYENLMERLFSAGALEVYYTPVIMKKSRPGILVSALSPLPQREAVCRVMFAESTTLGVRITEIERRCLEREFREIETRWGKVKIKVGLQEGAIVSAAPEYEDCRRLAQEHDVPLKEVYDEAKALAWQIHSRGGFTNPPE